MNAASQRPQRRRAEQWETNLRKLIRSTHGKGWSVRPIRGRTQVTLIWQDRSRSSIVTDLPWAGPESARILQLIGQLGPLVDSQRLPLAEAYRQLTGPGQEPGQLSWPEIVARFEAHKLASGQIKPTTWVLLYRAAMEKVLAAMAQRPAPRSGLGLLEAVARSGGGAPGSEGRRKRLQIVAQLLRYATARCGAPAVWAPPESLADLIGRRMTAKEPTVPLRDPQLRRLLAGVEDPRWRLALGLMGCFGLRPVEVWHCRPERGRLRVTYAKRTAAGPGKPRDVIGLDPEGLPGLSADLLAQLAERGPAGLPPLPPGSRRNPSRPLWAFLQTLPIWQELQAEAAAEGTPPLRPYSARHGFAYRASQTYGLSVRSIAALMGHTAAVHLGAYGSWADTEGLEAAVARAAARLALEAAGA